MVVGRPACEQMISLLKNALFLLILRLLIGGIFTVAGLEKIGSIAAFEQAILHYQLSGPAISHAYSNDSPLAGNRLRTRTYSGYLFPIVGICSRSAPDLFYRRRFFRNGPRARHLMRMLFAGP